MKLCVDPWIATLCDGRIILTNTKESGSIRAGEGTLVFHSEKRLPALAPPSAVPSEYRPHGLETTPIMNQWE